MNQPSPRLYTDLAHLWPYLSPPEDYETEASLIRRFLQERPHPPDRRLSVLELGAGGGHTLVHLANDFNCTALDLSEPMLARCRALLPDVRTVAADMRGFDLGSDEPRFDAVLAHDAIDYLTTPDDLRRCFAAVARHLVRGGLFLVAPTYTTETFADHEAAHDFRETPDGPVTYFSYVHDPDPDDTAFELILLYLIREKGHVRTVEDRHACGLFGVETWRSLLTQAGFAVEIPEQPLSERPHVLFIATRL